MTVSPGEVPGRPPDTESPGVRELIGKLKLDPTPLRESPAFRRLWLAQSASFIGSEVGYVALSYQVYALTGSTLAVGLLALTELIPMLTMTLVGGALADAFDRRRLMLLQQCGMIAGTAIILANTASGDPQVWPCFLGVFVTVAAFAFGAGAQHSMLPKLVSDDQLVAANNLNSLTSSLGAVAGPALAGVLIATVGLTTAYALDTVTFLLTLAAVWRLPSLRPEGGGDSPSLDSIVDGFRFISRMPVILGFMLVDTNAMIFGMPTALFPALATHRFHNPSLVGYLYAATYAGALLASLLGGWVNHVRRQGLIVVVRRLALGRGDRRVRVRHAAVGRVAAARGRRRRRSRQRGAARDDAARADAGLAARPPHGHRVHAGRERAVARQPRGRCGRVGHEHPHVDRLRRDLLRVRLLRARARVPGSDPLPVSCP